MNLAQVSDIMKEYSLSVLLIAFIVCGLTSLIKKWTPNHKKKFLTFVPFILGIILCAVYLLITEGASEILKSDTLTSGFQCGAAATTYYILYEQFIRGKNIAADVSKEEIVIMGVLSNTVNSECLEEVSKKLAGYLKEGLDDFELTRLCAELIRENAAFKISEAEILMLVNLIIRL